MENRAAYWIPPGMPRKLMDRTLVAAPVVAGKNAAVPQLM